MGVEKKLIEEHRPVKHLFKKGISSTSFQLVPQPGTIFDKHVYFALVNFVNHFIIQNK